MLCPICNNDYLIEGEQVDVGPGYVKCGPDHCEFCEYVECGCIDELSFSHFEKCWELQIYPHPPIVTSKRWAVNVKYKKWISENVKEAYGNCHRMCLEMVGQFPELRIIMGSYFCPLWGFRAHFWCITEDNIIVDPTISQFPSNGMGWYLDGVVISSESLLKKLGQ